MLLDDLRTDPVFAELIADFVDALPERMDKIRAARDAGDFVTIRTISHQLKGAGGGYGFMEITNVASVVESLSKPETEINFEKLSEQIERLASVCDAARLSL